MTISRCFVRLLCLLTLGEACLSISNQAFSATFYWDTNGPSPGAGSASSPVDWLSTSWAAAPGGASATGAWPNTQPVNDDEAVFDGASGTVLLAGDVYANALRFETNNYRVESDGGALHLTGDQPTITANLSSNGQTVTIAAPILGDAGLTLAGNSSITNGSGLRFLVLANTDGANPNAFTGTLTLEAGSALRLGGGVANEQIPDSSDMIVEGVIDFITSGGASDGKKERVRNVGVAGDESIFSVGNGSDFEVNSLTATHTTNVSVNGNNANVPGTLSITGWSDGSAALVLDDAQVRVNTTGAGGGIGGRIVLSGDVTSSGASQISNNNGGGTLNDNVFPHKALDLTESEHTIEVAGGVLTFTSRSSFHPLDVTSTQPAGTTLTKTGPGVLIYEHALQGNFAGANRIAGGTLRIGVSERLSDAAGLEIVGEGVFDLQSFDETVGGIEVTDGAILGNGLLTSNGQISFKDAVVDAKIGGDATVEVQADGLTVLNGDNPYTGRTTVFGTLIVNGTHGGTGSFVVESAGVLGGDGEINSSVVLHGTLSPGDSVGTFTANSVTFREDSLFAVEVSGSNADRVVLDSMSIEPTARLEVTPLDAFELGSYVIAEYGSRGGEFLFDGLPGMSLEYDDEAGELILHATHPGDFDLDGDVDGDDLDEWEAGFGASALGDADGNGTNNGRDVLAWMRNYQTGVAQSLVSVPEPNTLFLLLFSTFLGFGRRPQ